MNEWEDHTVNEIKMESSHVAAASFEKRIAHPQHSKTTEGVTVSAHLNQLVSQQTDAVNGEQSAAAVANIKQQIQAGTYSIDYNALSDKLLTNGVLAGA